jgi:GSCFA family
MKLQTQITIEPSVFKVNYQMPILTIGSCFAEVMGRQLSEEKLRMNVVANPFGTVFNVISIEKLLTQSIQNSSPSDDLYINLETDGCLHHDFHTMFWAKNQELLKAQLTEKQAIVRDFLIQKPIVIITLGTSLVYKHKASGQTVANCHKVSAAAFEKTLLDYEQTTNSLQNICKILKPFAAHIILTVSPVRHTRDSLQMNQVSKSLLRVACDAVVRVNSDVAYFPSYEIMIDELRDYRFYKEDLIHPSKQAENYIFECFAAAYFDAATKNLAENWQKTYIELSHRTINPQSESHQRFLKKLVERLIAMSEYWDVSREIEAIRQQILS